ncbi:MAG: glutaredoxin 3 [Thiohalospira sp.]|uniref:glutaredoxin 3 n=1 Tax=Thiohalospira sp. TaxID=3080549 RepID=UPI0039800749
MAHVEMYGTRMCPFCVRARHLLKKKGVDYDDIRVDAEPERRPEMVERAGGATSVPQIFIDGEHIGGCDELHDLERRDELDPLLEE